MPPKKSRRQPGNPTSSSSNNQNNNNNSNSNSNSNANSGANAAPHGRSRPRRGGRQSTAPPADPPDSPPSAKPDNDESSPSFCPICAERAKDWAIGSCGHLVCGDCSHRMRVLYNRNACVMCATDLRQVAVVPLRDYREGMTFEEAVALPGAFQDKQVEMWFIDRSRCQQLKNARGWMCSHRDCGGKGAQNVFAHAGQLRTHARNEHRCVYCEVCFAAKRSFVSEMQLFTLDTDRTYSTGLRHHLRKKHPLCKFCRRYFYDEDKLYYHLQEKHETCSICERNGRMHEYYADFAQLERHYRSEHYVCRDPECRGMVFSSQIELQTHEHTRHNSSRNPRSRGLRVNLQQLHGERNSGRRIGTPGDVRAEQERQAARRQAFLSSSVVFSGAGLNFDDVPAPSPENVAESNPQPSASSQTTTTPASSSSLPSASNPSAEVPRPPDDGHFYPLALPRNNEETQARNTVLVRTMRSLLDPASYEQFRVSSGEFQSGSISADDYYDAVTDAFGVRAAVRDILPELVALLPTPLLREPLLQTCLQRTDTKGNSAGYLGPSTENAGASSSASGRDNSSSEQFPSLNGNTAPVRNIPPSIRRFGAPGPEEFPRLGRVNKPQNPAGNTEGSSSRAPSSSSTSRPAAAPRPVGTASAASSRPQRTAATILRENPRPQPSTQRNAGNGMQRNRNPGPSVQLSANAFPALSAGASSTASSVPVPQVTPQSDIGEVSEPPPADVSMRVGAVWGGAAARSQSNRTPKKRGPGRGRIPASPPKRLIRDANDIPNVRAGSQSDNASSASEDQSSQAGSRQPNVIDVLEIAKSRRNAVQKSSLPKVGGSGYGFAWERRKLQQKKKQIKNTAQPASTNKANSSSDSLSTQLANNGRSNITITTDSIVATEPRQDSGPDLPSTFEDMNITADDSVDQSVEKPEDTFDPYSYLRDDSSKDDAMASFLGRS